MLCISVPIQVIIFAKFRESVTHMVSFCQALGNWSLAGSHSDFLLVLIIARYHFLIFCSKDLSHGQFYCCNTHSSDFFSHRNWGGTLFPDSSETPYNPIRSSQSHPYPRPLLSRGRDVNLIFLHRLHN